MTYEKITEEILKETKEPVIVEHKKADLENRKASLLKDKERVEGEISKADELLALFTK